MHYKYLHLNKIRYYMQKLLKLHYRFINQLDMLYIILLLLNNIHLNI